MLRGETERKEAQFESRLVFDVEIFWLNLLNLGVKPHFYDVSCK